MNPLGRRARLLLPLALGLLLGTGCGIPGSVSTQNRPDMAASVPPSGDLQAAIGSHQKARHGKAKHVQAAKPKPRQPRAWSPQHDISGISFRLPTATIPVAKDTALPGGGTVHSRVYTSRSAEGFEVAAGFQTFDRRVSTANLSRVADQIVAQLRAAGAGDARVERTSKVRVGGNPATDTTISFTPVKNSFRKVLRIRTVLRGRRLLVTTQTVGFAERDSAALRARIGSVQQRLNGLMRLG